jgi:cytochrome c oxidase subunit 4
MAETKERELKGLNLVLLLLAVGSLGVAAWTVATYDFRAGTDDLFLVLVCLLLALLFAINPLMWAHSKGWLTTPFALDDELAAEGPGFDHAAHDSHGGTDSQNTKIWGILLGLTAFEVFLAYIKLDLTLMVIILMGASIIKAALIVAFFMHLKFERLSLILTIVPTLVILFCLFAIFFPDSFRLHGMRIPEMKDVPAPTEQVAPEK